MQTCAIGLSVRLEEDGFGIVRVGYNAARRSAHSDYVPPENLQVSIGDLLTIFGAPALVIDVLQDALAQSEAALAAVNRSKEAA